MLDQVISGGQTGADRIGLETARDIGLKTGGKAPRGWWTENGPDLTLKNFGLVESRGNYNYRTIENVQESNATVLFGNMMSSGSFNTIRACLNNTKPHLTNPTPEALCDWIILKDIHTLNVAGNRGSKLSIRQKEDIRTTLTKAFNLLNHKNFLNAKK